MPNAAMIHERLVTQFVQGRTCFSPIILWIPNDLHYYWLNLLIKFKIHYEIVITKLQLNINSNDMTCDVLKITNLKIMRVIFEWVK